MSSLPPILCEWDGEVFRPAMRFVKLCAEHLKTGVIYPIVLYYERSTSSHQHYFAALKEIWMNLPDHEAIRFPTIEHLRKYALIHTGWSIVEDLTLSSRRDALLTASFIQRRDQYCVVAIERNTIRVHTAVSQKYRAMGKADFEASKSAVLNWASQLIEIPVEIVASEARHTGR